MTDELFYRHLIDQLADGVYFVDRERRITYWNRSAERLTGFSAEEVLGRSCQDNILQHVNERGQSLCTGACPLARTILDGEPQSDFIYLKHKQGHRVAVQVRTTAILDEAGKIVGGAEVFSEMSLQQGLVQRLRELEELALLDSVTRVANRRHMEANLQSRLDEFERYGWSFGLLFVDIDGLKSINDSLGHGAGDKLLQLVALTLSNSLRPFDLVSRWGGDEFVALLVHIDAAQLRLVAERARGLVAESELILDQQRRRITVSIGATLARRGESSEELLQRADGLMYRSKAEGKNRVSCDSPEPAISVSN